MTADVHGGIRERKRAATRDAVVTAATRLFLERGLSGTSIDDIAAAAGIARRTFFLHFPAKEDVLFHYLEGHVGRAIAALDDLPDDLSDGPPDDGAAGSAADSATGSATGSAGYGARGVRAVMTVLVDLFDDPRARTDELAGLRTELVTAARGLPPSLVVRLQRAQSDIVDALRVRYPDPVGWPVMSAHLGACMGAAAAAAVAVERPDLRAAAIRDAVTRAGAGFERGPRA
ncbi:TetR/AcrR family transcriptional regulator [Promicromonospora sp. NPDC057488]|uniref:TetR/AcrR family transcriptional regulator n=1 Tax=Promicromonospora sp. NPDC057488 TaxID=3346147 RepID=UPI003670B2D7